MASTLIGEGRKGTTGQRLNGTTIEEFDTYHYRVYTDTVNATREEVKQTAGLPTIGISMLPNGAACSSKVAERSEINPRYWDVVCEFSTQSKSQQPPANNDPDPTTWIPIWKIDYENVDFVAAADRNGTHMLNSARGRFDEGIIWTMPVSVWRFTQYFPATTTEREVAAMSNIMNNGLFADFPRNTLFLTVTGSEIGININGYAVRRVDFVIKYFEGFAEAGQYKYFDKPTQTWTTATWPSGWQELRLDIADFDKDGFAYISKQGHRGYGPLDGAGIFKNYGEIPELLAFDRCKEEDFSRIVRVA